jgi:hypothetical protein
MVQEFNGGTSYKIRYLDEGLVENFVKGGGFAVHTVVKHGEQR